jgi:SAM-dependent methyltransferase
VLEIGCGAGALLSELATLGFHCTGLETSERARTLAKAFVSEHPSVAICDTPVDSWQGAFDYVLAFEVLEHIEDDEAALRQWTSWLKPGGSLLLSVPAHQALWNDADVWAGHYRRYERRDLRSVCVAAGLRPVVIESYGYPLANWVEPIRAYMSRQRLRAEPATDKTREEFTSASGVERSKELKLFPLFGRLPGALALLAFCQLQRLFLKTDRGNGYLVHASR